MGDEGNTEWAEKVAKVFEAFKRSLDVEVAIVSSNACSTTEERQRMRADPELLARCEVELAGVKEDLIQNIREIARAARMEGVKLSANKDLGRMLYPERFKDVDPPASNVSTFADLSNLSDEELMLMKALMEKANKKEKIDA